MYRSQRRANNNSRSIVDTEVLSHLVLLQLRRDVVSFSAAVYSTYHGECSEELQCSTESQPPLSCSQACMLASVVIVLQLGIYHHVVKGLTPFPVAQMHVPFRDMGSFKCGEKRHLKGGRVELSNHPALGQLLFLIQHHVEWSF